MLSISSWGSAVRTMTVGMVWRAGVPSRTGMVMMGSVEVTTLHPQGPGDAMPPGTRGGAVLARGLLERGTSRR
jgi:hypothetical protein